MGLLSFLGSNLGLRDRRFFKPNSVRYSAMSMSTFRPGHVKVLSLRPTRGLVPRTKIFFSRFIAADSRCFSLCVVSTSWLAERAATFTAPELCGAQVERGASSAFIWRASQPDGHVSRPAAWQPGYIDNWQQGSKDHGYVNVECRSANYTIERKTLVGLRAVEWNARMCFRKDAQPLYIAHSLCQAVPRFLRGFRESVCKTSPVRICGNSVGFYSSLWKELAESFQPKLARKFFLHRLAYV